MSIDALNDDLNIISELVIPLFEEDVNVISKLDDEPNSVGGLSAAELKAKFDESGNIIKRYLNEVLVPGVSGTVAEEEVRASNETQRVFNENQRVSNENERVAAEESRVAADSDRMENENIREENEARRNQAEAERLKAEQSRVKDEQARAEAETARAKAEVARDEAERARAEETSGIVAQATEQAKKAEAAAETAGQVKNMTVRASSLSAGSEATVNKSVTNGTLTISFGIPRGERGEQGATGKAGSPGADGKDGRTPVRGTDYWTSDDKAAIVQDVLEEIPDIGDDVVKTTAQTLTEEQKAQVRANIGAAEAESENGVSETLEFTYTTSYPNGTTFTYTEQETANGYWVFKPGEIQGGTLSVSWDTTQLTQFDIILFLFDADGNPYKYIQAGGPQGTNKTLAGELNYDDLIWFDPGTGYGFCKANAPFTLEIPDGCTALVCMRSANAVFPNGSSVSQDFYIHAATFFDVTISKTTSNNPGVKLDRNQGKKNANRRMVTNALGEIVPGEIDPHSMALRPNWDTVIHRGWIAGAKENTIPAFYLAKENGYSWVECDVRMTSDGIPVLVHDAAVTGTNASGASVTLTVAETTLADLQAVVLETHERFGEIRTNTLAELLDMARCLGMKLLLDIKIGGEISMKAIAKEVLRYGMGKNVVYMPVGVDNARHIASIDKNANFDFAQLGTSPTAATDFSGYTSLLTGSNRINLGVQADAWSFDEDVISAINAAGLGLSAWNVLRSNVARCIDAGVVRLTKHNQEDATDLDAIYFADKAFW